MIAYHTDRSDDFWPERGSWMIYACVVLGIFDASIITFIVFQLVKRT